MVVGLVVAAGLVLIPIVMIGRVLIAIITESREARAAEARRVTRSVAGLGDFSSTDNELWLGDVAGLQVSLVTAGGPPTDTQAEQVRAIIADLPRLVDKSRTYLATQEDCARLGGRMADFQPYGIEPEDPSSFVLELTHADDVDGVYRVTFRGGQPISYARDD